MIHGLQIHLGCRVGHRIIRTRCLARQIALGTGSLLHPVPTGFVFQVGDRTGLVAQRHPAGCYLLLPHTGLPCRLVGGGLLQTFFTGGRLHVRWPSQIICHVISCGSYGFPRDSSFSYPFGYSCWFRTVGSKGRARGAVYFPNLVAHNRTALTAARWLTSAFPCGASCVPYVPSSYRISR